MLPLLFTAMLLLGVESPEPADALPSGAIILIDSGSCPAGYTQDTALGASAFPMGTVAANNDVGGTGGANTFTPTGTVAAPTFTGTAGTVPAQTFTGTSFSSVINHTHTVTVTSLVQGGTTAATTGTHLMTSTATGGSARAPTSGDSFTATTANPGGGVSSITPAGTNSTAAFTPAGTNSAPAFTGSATDQRPSYVKVIFCKAN